MITLYMNNKMMLPIGTIIILVTILVSVRGGEYTNRFLELYGQILNDSNGYYSKEGVPYHGVETLMIESVDYGHEADSEAISYNIWLQAMYGEITGDFGPFNQAWNIIESYSIPTMQNNTDLYNENIPRVVDGVTVGVDPIGEELRSIYGDKNVRVMHWLLDVDNIYGFGNIQGQCESGPSASGPSLINIGSGTLYEGVTNPTCDTFKFGGPYGFSWNPTVPFWQYFGAPDADARVIQAAFWASTWAAEKGKLNEISNTLSKAAELGDYLRYSFFDTNYKKIGNCIGGTVCPAATGKESAHYLLSWYIGWGGSINAEQGFSWRMGSGESHIGYQNPITAFALVYDENLRPRSKTGVEDWQNSLRRQLEFYNWSQTSEGLLGGGVTNSWNYNYADPPSAVKTNSFYGMWYESQPGFVGSSDWFGMQSWTVDRLAQYYYLTGDQTSKSILDKWIAWTLKHVTVTSSSFSVPLTLSWTGNTPSDAKATVVAYENNVGIASSIARTLAYYAAKSGDQHTKNIAKKLLDAIWATARDSMGVSVPRVVAYLSQVNTKVSIGSPGWTGTYPNGDKINASATFLDIRSWYRKDPNWNALENFLKGGPAPVLNYHRFWEQADMALALGAYGLLFNE